MKYMNGMWPLLGILLLFTAWGSNVVLADESESSRVDQMVTVLQTLASLAKKEAPNQGRNDFNLQVRKAVEDAVPTLDADQLGKLAIICLTLYSGDASNVGYDEVYYAGFWICVDRLFKKGDDSSLEALRFVQNHGRLDGGEKLMFDETMGNLQKRCHK